MSIQGKLYVLATIAVGYCTLGAGLIHWRSDDPTRFLCYVAFAALAAVLKIRLPSIIGTVSVHFALILVCIATLTQPETLVIACASVALQCALDSKPQKRLLSIAFHMASSAIAVTLGYATYQTFAASHILSTPPLVMVVAACVYFFANTVPEVLFTAVTERKAFAKLWEESCFWTFPHYIAGGAAAGLMTMTDRRGGWEMTLLILPVLYWMYHSYKFYLARLDDERRNGQDLMALQIRTIEALAVAIEGKDPVEQGHHSRIYIYTAEIGREMGLSAPELQALHAAALLRDIGRLAVPEHIFSKSGKLTEAEFEKVKTHPVAGAEILERIDFPYPVAPIVLAHHEKWDGSGYPAGLKGKEIPLSARILAVVDCLDALVSERHYRRAVSLQEAVQHILSESGKSFDPRVVEVMVLSTHKLERMVEEAERHPKISRRVSLPREASHGETSSSKPQHEISPIAAARQEARQILELAQELGNSLSVDETLSVLAVRIKRLCPYDAIAIYIRRDEFLQPEYASGEDCQFFGSLAIPWGEGLSGWVAEHRTPIVNGDPSAEGHATQSTRSTLMQSALVVPLEGLNGVVGVLAVYARNELAFTNDHLRILSAVTTKVALSVENALKYRQVERSAVTDVLTGLPNARALFEHLDSELARARRQEKQLAVVVCDLDGFKQVNDRLGHLAGNRVLRSMGAALKNTCREYDYVARMGGDEFVLVLSDYRSESLAVKTEQLSRAVAQSGLETVNRKLGISVGAAIFPADGIDAESLLAVADQRMYQAKRRRGVAPVAPWPAETVGQSVQ